MKLKPTQQQQEIIEYAKTGNPFKISAFAGAAKTSTLVMIADELTHDSLYLAYNKRMADEAKERFPGWVEVRTTHSLAYKAVGMAISHKLSRPAGAYKNVAGTASEIGRYFKITPLQLINQQKISQVALGKVVRDTVNNFEYSADKRLTEKHIVFGSTTKYLMSRLIDKRKIVQAVLKPAQELWKLRSDPSSSVLATHETYLKLYQLSNPDLSEYKTIYLDEAQDSNECILNIIMKQTTQVILVGDHYQSIYQWRGSTNALAKVPMESKVLSTSFRFGDAIADVANLLLNASENVSVQGFDKIDSQVTDKPDAVPYPYTKIYRTNAGLISDAIGMLARGEKVHVEVDFRDLIRAIESGVALFEGNMKGVKHDTFISCIDWKDAVEEAKYSGEMKRIVDMISSDYYTTVLEVLRTYSPPDDPNVLMITAHKSKGLEWDNVVIANDYRSVYDETGNYTWPEEERNLSYVAHTRAKKILCVGDSVQEVLDKVGTSPVLRERIDARLHSAEGVLEYLRGMADADKDTVHLSEDDYFAAHDGGLEEDLLLMPDAGRGYEQVLPNV